MKDNKRCKIGTVIEVNSDRVIIEVSNEINNYNIINNGILFRIGQVGSFIKIITGMSLLYGVVESFSTFMQSGNITVDKKVLSVTLLGYRTVSGDFERGARITPSIDDAAYIIDEEDIEVIFKSNVKFPVKIGDNYFSNKLPVYINLNEFILKHSFIVGSTGSGKSNTVAYMLNNIIEDYKNSRVLMIDIHGEYMQYLNSNAKEYSIYNSSNRLTIPYWLLDFETLCKLFEIPYGSNYSSTAADEFRDRILRMKKAYIVEKSLQDKINLNDIDVNSPIPFSINEIWYEFYKRGYGTFSNTDRTEQYLEYEIDSNQQKILGNAKYFEKPVFKAYSPNNSLPLKSNELFFKSVADNIYKVVLNESFDFMFGNDEFIDGTKNINELIVNWIDNEKQITILNLSGIPYQIIDVVIGIITNLIFEIVYYSIKVKKINEGRPVLMCFEEAHKYLNSINGNGYSLKAVERIMKEGRKFGLGAMLISQRPTEISNTIISQVSTFIALRLTNSEDQSRIVGFAPNNFSVFLKSLSSLGTGEAFVIGESMKIPMKVKIPLLDSVKNIEFDSRIGIWQNQRADVVDYTQTIERWMQK
jgi:hypothetical protein